MTTRLTIEEFRRQGLKVNRSGRIIGGGTKGGGHVVGQKNMSHPWHGLLAKPYLSAELYRLLRPEQILSIAIADKLRDLSLAGQLHAVWSATAPELPARGRFVQAWQAIRSAMGCVPGVPDFVLTWAGGGGWIELKRQRGDSDLFGHRIAAGQLSTNQRAFREWVNHIGCNHAVIHSLDELDATLKLWGCLRIGE